VSGGEKRWVVSCSLLQKHVADLHDRAFPFGLAAGYDQHAVRAINSPIVGDIRILRFL